MVDYSDLYIIPDLVDIINNYTWKGQYDRVIRELKVRHKYKTECEILSSFLLLTVMKCDEYDGEKEINTLTSMFKIKL